MNFHLNTSCYLGFEPDTKERFENIWNNLSPEGHIKLFISTFEDQPLSALLLLCFGDTATCYRFGWSREHAQKRPNDALYWHAILWAKNNGYHYFDFGEIELDAARKLCQTEKIPEEYLHSSVSFKMDFGGRPVLYPETYILFSKPIMRWLYDTFVCKLIDLPPVQKITSAIAG